MSFVSCSAADSTAPDEIRSLTPLRQKQVHRKDMIFTQLRLGMFVASSSENPKLRYLRAFNQRKNEGFSGQNGLIFSQKAGKKRGLQLLILQQEKMQAIELANVTSEAKVEKTFSTGWGGWG
jgi:hypothetical protein